ncbi:3-hydroxyacyl-CoA dehydrogenase NAD-binding domain-containing protein [Sphingobium fuliginis]|uniref:3-hydroxyacyl-CoA dehydrogenase n=1 Tax=Sphingobium fuliginis ATCC 27551 TaxID=1208342 RepID=A0A5B8CI39_SPHSA|nr:3-hydroxyacyl-CoA dehydrogenase NAD-binding domain-containing protein [Sphingobium fuliginis]QDC37757.1 3-hydroxyacyl-CoA dehydrogenase [Sphingobium fuliginis ATCC 27551]
MIETNLHDNVLEIVITNPPVNALGADVRCALAAALADAQTNDAVKAIVIRGAGKIFSGGADITEFDGTMAEPGLPELVNMVEACTKPVVAAIHGSVLGGGLEISLGSHYRIAAPDAELGLPEVLLGIVPGAGGTQRLPRLIGAEAALNMIVSGSPVSATKAEKMGLVDRLATDAASLPGEAIAYARTLDAPRRTGERDATVDPAFFEKFLADNAGKKAYLDAQKGCVEAVRAATELPLDEGLVKEAALFTQLVSGEQSKALRHIFFAERKAAKVDGLPKDTQPRSIARVGVIGAGTMGGGISMNFLSAGIPVTIVETQQEALDRGTGIVRKNYEATAAKGRLTPEQVETAMSLLAPTLDFEALSECDLIIEAVYENMDLKKEIFGRLDTIAKPGAILASNTSFLDIDEMAAATKRPQDVLGLHFFSPANIMKLVEVVRGAQTAPDVLATGMAIARRIGKVPVVSGVCYGFIGNRMLNPRLDGAIDMLVEGATPEQVDRVSTELGLPMGPLQMLDLAGVDIGWHRDPTRIESVRDALNAAGRWGQKAKAGFYDYDERRRPAPSPAAAEIIDGFRAQAGVTPREISAEEIAVRTLYVMVNEGAKILEEDIAQRASDIDVVWNYGYGWPRHKGGPMFWADQMGLDKIVDALRRYADRLGPDFSLSPLLVRCAEQGAPLDK